MAEIAVNTPFDSGEIKDIACQEFRKRLDGLSPLMGAKEYASFEIKFHVGIKLCRIGEVTTPKDTLAWGSAQGGEENPEHEQTIANEVSSFESGDPNTERQARGMPLTVETTDGRGGKTRKRVLVKE